MRGSVKKIFSAVFVLVMLMTAIPMRAQSDLMFSQYWALPAYYNPAATGEIDFVRIRGGARMQWLGIDNAPKSFLVTADSPFQIGKTRIGAGVNMTQESMGLFSNMLVNVQGSYKFKFLKGRFSIGVQGGYYNTRFRGSEVSIPEGDDFHDSSDEAIPTRDLTGNAFDLSAGIWYTHKYFSIGVSGMHLLAPTVSLNSEGTESAEVSQYETKLNRQLYFTAAGNIELKNTLFELQPSLLFNTDFNNFGGEVTLRSTYRKLVWLGLGYRYNDAVSVMAGVEFKNFFVGYAYDYPTSAISKVSSGSHELVVGYQLKLNFNKKNKNKHRSIRIM